MQKIFYSDQYVGVILKKY
ncbi:MAG: hypothetical protein ACLRR3_08765 [Eubacterium sp.]